MKKIIIVLSALMLFAAQSHAQKSTVISGTLLGADGKPMVKSEVHLQKTQSSKPLQTVQTKGDGRFELTVQEKGVYYLSFTGINHYQSFAPVSLEVPAEIKVEVRLKQYAYVKNFDDVGIIGDFNDFNMRKAVPMTRQDDGTFVFEHDCEGKTFAYQIMGAESVGHSVNGTQADSYEYDNGGDYRSVVNVASGKVKVVFDPKKLPNSEEAGEAVVQFDAANVLQAQLLAGMQKRNQYRSSRRAYYTAHGQDLSGFTYDWSEALTAIPEKIATEKERSLRQVLLMQYLQIGGTGAAEELNKKLVAQALTDISPRSPLWSLSPDLMFEVVNWAEDKANGTEYLEQALQGHADSEVRANIFFAMLNRAEQDGDAEQLQTVYERMMREAADAPLTRYAKTRFNPNRATQSGKQLPAFSIKSLDHPDVIYSNEKMKGKIYLLDFWATWCGPCIAEMPGLHELYKKYKNQNFEILSLSFDGIPGVIGKFRGKKWNMPWLHAFVEGGFDSDLAQTFQVVGIPKPILVDGNSNSILATEDELRGEQFEKTLTKFLGKNMDSDGGDSVTTK